MSETLALARLIKRRHPRMNHLWEAVECPFCHAPVGDPCHTSTGRRADTSHGGRIDTFNAEML